MVADIRVGFMDRNLDVPNEIKSTFESINYPRPQLAQTLDATFRELGFHKKVLGKDIKLSKFLFGLKIVKKGFLKCLEILSKRRFLES